MEEGKEMKWKKWKEKGKIRRKPLTEMEEAE